MKTKTIKLTEPQMSVLEIEILDSVIYEDLEDDEKDLFESIDTEKQTITIDLNNIENAENIARAINEISNYYDEMSEGEAPSDLEPKESRRISKTLTTLYSKILKAIY